MKRAEMPQFLYTISPTRPAMLVEGPTEQEAALVGQHFAYLQRALSAETLILAGRTQNSDPSSFGIVIFRAESEEAARAFMAADPAVEGGVMEARLYPYRVALMGS